MDKIYIIEDDANILAGLEAKLSLLDYETIADSGTGDIDDIINRIKIEKPLFIILDLILPELDGFNIVRTIKGDWEINKIPIIVFTNLIDADSKTRSERMGVEFYFVKSEWHLDDFIEKIKRILANYAKRLNR